MTLSILIVNWNSKDYLRKCLGTVRATCAEFSPQIVVVDGASFDGCGEMLAAEFPEVEFVQSPDNVGFGRANNLGFERVTGETLLLLNPDCELLPGAVAELLARLDQLPSPGILAPRLLNTDGSLQISCVQALPTPLNQVLDAAVLRRWFPRSRLWGTCAAFGAGGPVAVEAVSGACMLLRSEVFRQVGGFSPLFFMYGEDIDLCARVRKLGLQNFHVPAARVVHHGGGSSSGQFSRVSALFFHESVYRVIRSHRGVWSAWTYRLLMVAAACCRLLLLVPFCLFSLPVQGRLAANSFRKWLTVCRWSLGLERRVVGGN